MQALKTVGRYFRRVDQFGEPVTLNYRGKSQYQTKTGALLTIICFAIISSLIYMRGKKLVTRVDPSITQVQQGIDLLNNQDTFNLQFNNYGFGVALVNEITKQVFQIPDNFLDLKVFQTYRNSKDTLIISNSTSPCQLQIDESSNQISSQFEQDIRKYGLCSDFRKNEIGSDMDIYIMIDLKCRQDNSCGKIQELNRLPENVLLTVFSLESTVDFMDYKRPLHTQLPPISKFSVAQFNQSQNGYLELNILNLASNTLNLKDNIYQNPFSNTAEKTLNYLTSFSQRISLEPMIKFKALKITNSTLCIVKLSLNRLSIANSRTVYSVVDFLAEIGGLYGLLIIGAEKLIKLLNKQKLYVVSLIKHMQPIFPQGSSYKRKHSLRFRPLVTKLENTDKVFKVSQDDFVVIMGHMSRYFKLRISLWTRIVAFYLPSMFHSLKTKQELEIIKKAQKKVESCLDVRRLIRNDDDLQLLLKLLMSKQCYWLFRHQRSRHLWLEKFSNNSKFKDRDNQFTQYSAFRSIKNWEVKSILDHRLLKGLFV